MQKNKVLWSFCAAGIAKAAAFFAEKMRLQQATAPF
jgi:hypothetical protein